MSKNIGKKVSRKYNQKLLDDAKQSDATDVLKTPSKRECQKTAEATDLLTGNKIADKITRVSRRTTPLNTSTAVTNEAENIEHNKKTSPKKRWKNY